MNAVEQRQCYYRSPDVRARMREFLGATSNGQLSCEFLAASDENASPPFTPYSPWTLNSLLDSGFEICRSLWDRDALIYWTLDSEDGVEPVKTAQFLIDRITSKSDAELDGAIILLHVGVRSTADALPAIISNLQARGFQLVTVSKLLQ